MNGDNSNNFSEIMKVAVIEIAKFLIKEEINYNIKDIHPVYDPETMTPSWKVDSLLSAVYFSIFYLKPDLELYRPCDNPRCGRYFLVNTTSTRKRFCSKECCNRVTQDRYRKRKGKRRTIKIESLSVVLQTEILQQYFLYLIYIVRATVFGNHRISRLTRIRYCFRKR